MFGTSLFFIHPPWILFYLSAGEQGTQECIGASVCFHMPCSSVECASPDKLTAAKHLTTPHGSAKTIFSPTEWQCKGFFRFLTLREPNGGQTTKLILPLKRNVSRFTSSCHVQLIKILETFSQKRRHYIKSHRKSAHGPQNGLEMEPSAGAARDKVEQQLGRLRNRITSIRLFTSEMHKYRADAFCIARGLILRKR